MRVSLSVVSVLLLALVLGISSTTATPNTNLPIGSQFDFSTQDEFVTVHQNIPYWSVGELERELGIYHQFIYNGNIHEFVPPTPLDQSSPNVQSSFFVVNDGARYMTYNEAAYTDNDSQVQNWSCPWCKHAAVKGFKVTHLVKDSKTKTFAFVGYNPNFNEIVVSFRGSDNIRNWIENLKFFKTDKTIDGLPKAKTTIGFYNCFKGLRDGVYQAVLSNIKLNPSYTIKIIGHSLGGAIASITALDFSYNAKLKVSTYTHGSPRVGDAGFRDAFSQYVQGSYWRMTHNDDPVPHVPPHAFSFRHVAHEIFQFDVKGQYIQCSLTNTEDPNCADRYKTPLISMDIQAHLHYMNLTLNGQVQYVNDAIGKQLNNQRAWRKESSKTKSSVQRAQQQQQENEMFEHMLVSA